MSDAVGGRGIGCQIGRTSPWSCFTGQGVAQSCFVRNAKRGASSPGYCGWCGDTIRQGLAACSRAAQLADGSLGTLHGGGVQEKNGIMVPMFCGLFMWDYPYKNEITRVIHSIMVLSCFGPFMWEFPYKKRINMCCIYRGFCAQDDAKRCKMMQDTARRCKIMQDNARCCKMV